MRKRKPSFVFEPRHAVIRLEQVWPIEHVAIGQQHVVVAIAIEIDDLNAA